MNKYITELIGTFFLVLTIGLSGNPIAIGVVLAALVYMGGHISGAHYNPAVSLAIFLRKQLSAKDLGLYIIFQVLGAILAALAVLYVMGTTFGPSPSATTDFTKSVIVELLFTFGLALVVLNVATTRKNAGNSYYGIAIGFTVLAAAAAGGPISGGAFNPAVALGPHIVDAIKGGSLYENLLVYLIGPFAGAALASVVFKSTNPIEFKDVDLTYHES